MTDDELDRLQALADEATAGPWEYHDRGTNYDWDVTGPRCLDLSGYVKGMFWNRENAAFIAASRDAMPALIAEVRRLRELLSQARQVLLPADSCAACAFRLRERMLGDSGPLCCKACKTFILLRSLLEVTP